MAQPYWANPGMIPPARVLDNVDPFFSGIGLLGSAVVLVASFLIVGMMISLFRKRTVAEWRSDMLRKLGDKFLPVAELGNYLKEKANITTFHALEQFRFVPQEPSYSDLVDRITTDAARRAYCQSLMVKITGILIILSLGLALLGWLLR